MTQNFNLESLNYRQERAYFKENTDFGLTSEIRDKSYELYSEILPQSNASDSFTTTGQSSRTSRKSELKSLRGERFIAKLCRSASNSPRIEYNSNSFLENVKAKANLAINQKAKENNDRKSSTHARNPSHDIEELENQWQAMKAQHNFESRESNSSPYKFQFAPDSSNLSKVSISKKDQAEIYNPAKKMLQEKNQPVTSLLSKVIPQAKINLVQPSMRGPSRSGGNHSKSVEPKQVNLSKEKSLREEPKKEKTTKITSPQVNKKLELFDKKRLDGKSEMPKKTQESFSEISKKESLVESKNTIKITYSPISKRNVSTKIITPSSNTSINSEKKNQFNDFQTASTFEYFIMNESENIDTKTFQIDLTQTSISNKDLNSRRPKENYGPRKTLQPKSIGQEESKMTKRKENHSPLPTSEMRTKILFYEPSHKEQEESLFNAPATLEKLEKSPNGKPSPCKAVNVIKTMNLNANCKQKMNPVSAFTSGEEKNENVSKENFKDYFDTITDKIKLKLKATKQSDDEKEIISTTNENDPSKRNQNSAIQRPFQFVTKESNFSPIKKVNPDQNLASKLRKENQTKNDKKTIQSSLRQVYQIDTKIMSKEKIGESSESLETNIKNTDSQNQSSRNEIFSSLKTDFMSLESARMQKHKTNMLNPTSKGASQNEIKNKDNNGLYLVTTQDDITRETSLERSKIKLMTNQGFEISRTLVLNKKDENELKQIKYTESESINSKLTKKIPPPVVKSKSLKVKK